MTGEARPRQQNDYSVVITGSGGSGAVTTGWILLDAAARAGYYGLMTRSAGPQIRGGESAAMVRFSISPVYCLDDRFDVVVGLDWRNVSRFADEIPMDSDSLILADPTAGEVPTLLTASGARIQVCEFKHHAAAVEKGRINMVSLGAIAAVTRLPLEALEAGVHATLARKGASVVEAAITCIRAGFSAAAGGEKQLTRIAPQRWNISGNEAAGLGALRAGVRFVAAYPITPASEMLEWLAPRLERFGGALLQAEDELASVNMIIGSSFGGVSSLTATSGPGLSLMMEGLGLAVASETPVVVVNVMRGGPSTGIPTKSEQSDLNIALYGFHGDAPHLVLAAISIRDCAFTTQWGVYLAEHLQTVAIVLSDQSLGQSRAISDPPETCDPPLRRVTTENASDSYQRYAETKDGISSMSCPGVPGGMYTGEGLEHDPTGAPSSMASDHAVQLEKRRRKLADFDYGPRWAEIRGDGTQCIVTWGSASGAAFEAAERLERRGTPTRTIALRLLAPLPRQALLDALVGAERVLVVEQNQGAQLFRYLHAQQILPDHARSLARPGPLPLRPREIMQSIKET